MKRKPVTFGIDDTITLLANNQLTNGRLRDDKIFDRATAPFVVETTSLVWLVVPRPPRLDSSIIIKEKKAGALPIGKLYIGVDTLEFYENTGDVLVTKGDLHIKGSNTREVDGFNDGKRCLYMNIDRKSTVPSMIEISELTVAAPMLTGERGAKLDLIMGGDLMKDYDNDTFVAFPAIIHFVGIGPEKTDIFNTVVFDLDNKTMYVNGVMKEYDSFPQKIGEIFVDKLIPIKTLFLALGVEEDGIIWSPIDKSITILAEDYKVIFWINRKDIYVDGAYKYLGIAPIILEGKTYISLNIVDSILHVSERGNVITIN